MGGMGNEPRIFFRSFFRGTFLNFCHCFQVAQRNRALKASQRISGWKGWKGFHWDVYLWYLWENTDRASLLMDEIAALIAVKRGARRECVLTLARFASRELNRCVRAAIGNASGLTQGQWRRCLDQVVAKSDHVADLLVADWVVFRL